ncbi:hypothetical protein EO95_02785 [Methanosarcina sp. 1.H.T.1A.1]|uniref:hypothetical protein n=1 Tax=Methanosarcina sp. 1.H.T.1A.1 TaxID=1483602 RepID=UPI0006225AC5|nr:hypothetical protein [Methanosarcina sp. 1.H.T.1A.1]KKH92333.1 hypothetical protein EO95_02785 [Methanosarcina sp. 1.H.T.1A.1]
MKYAFQRKTLFMIILFCATAGILIAPASADVKYWSISPENPSVGDIIKISGEAESKEIIEVSILHEEIVPVSGTGYVYQINSLKIPPAVRGGKSFFSVTASGEDDSVKVKDINVRVKKGRWFSRHADASDDFAGISQSNVPSWMNYLVKIDGNVLEKSEGNVILAFESRYEAAKADKKGNFKFSYDTKSLPSGDYTITIGDEKKKFDLSPAEESVGKKKQAKCL